MQPFVDAAFKKRGLDPENFWRSAGCRIPVARTPQRHPFPQRRARAAAAGAGGHPGASGTGRPARIAVLVHSVESRCGKVTVGDEGLPRPWNPLPCAGATIGPFGGPFFPAPTDVMTSPPNPNGLPAPAGIPICRAAGDPPPDVVVPHRCRCTETRRPAGATEGVVPAGPEPPPSTFAPGLPPGPPAPPGLEPNCRDRSSTPAEAEGSGCHGR